MIRRNSERDHKYSEEVFKELKIFDIQGLLKEGDIYNCGVEAYQVKDFNLINFSELNQDEEIARLLFCNQLKIPYYIIITSENTKTYQIYKTIYSDNKIDFELDKEYNKIDAMEWWKKNQSFEQKKKMYNAAHRIQNNIIDNDLFSSKLSWGVNVDGFILNSDTQAIVEKRITKKTPLIKYDPNKFFHFRGGDFPSWNILFNLSQQLKVPLILMTFDTINKNIGASVIINVDRNMGVTYKNNIKPNQNIFCDDINGLNEFLNESL